MGQCRLLGAYSGVNFLCRLHSRLGGPDPVNSRARYGPRAVVVVKTCRVKIQFIITKASRQVIYVTNIDNIMLLI